MIANILFFYALTANNLNDLSFSILKKYEYDTIALVKFMEVLLM